MAFTYFSQVSVKDETRCLAWDYINSRLLEEDLQLELAAQVQKPSMLRLMCSHCERNVATILWTAMLQTTDLSSDASFLSYLKTISAAITAQSANNMHSIVIIFAIAGVMALYLVQMDKRYLAMNVADWTVSVLDGQLLDWIEVKGGWSSILRLKKCSDI